MQPGFWEYWQTRAHSIALVPGGPAENSTLSFAGPLILIIVTLQTGQTCLLS